MPFSLTAIGSRLCIVILFLLSCHWFCATASGEETPGFPKGQELFQAGQYDAAQKEFEQSLLAEPGNSVVHFYLGLVLTKQEKYEEALAAFGKALELDPDFKEVYLNVGIVHYKAKAYDAAQDDLKLAIASDPENGSARFFMGLTLQAKGLYGESLPFFEQAAESDPEFRQLALYYQGLAYYKMGQIERSKNAFALAQKADPGSGTARDSLEFLNLMADQEKKNKPWTLDATASFQYDDNVTQTNQDIVTNKPDKAEVYELYANYKLIDRKPFKVHTSYNFYQSLFEEATDLNFQSHSGNIGVSRDAGSWDANLDYTFYYSYLGTADFLKLHSVTPSFGFSIRQNMYAAFSYVFQDKDFIFDNPRDAANHSAGFNNFVFFMENKAYAQAGYRFDNESATGPEFDYAGHAFTGGINLPLPMTSWANVTYQYTLKDYKNVTPSIGEDRRDRRQSIKLRLTKTFLRDYYARLIFENIQSDSNLPSVDFKENIVTVGIGLNW